MTTTFDNVIAGIADGHYDAKLDTLQEAIRVRREHKQRVSMISMRPGSRVRFNTKTKPRYLIGAEGTVTKKNQKTVVVDLDSRVTSPQGRSWHRNIRVPVGLLEVVE